MPSFKAWIYEIILNVEFKFPFNSEYVGNLIYLIDLYKNKKIYPSIRGQIL